jgi:hypothetical protein
MGMSGQNFTASKVSCANLRRLGWPQGRSGRVLEKKISITPPEFKHWMDMFLQFFYL